MNRVFETLAALVAALGLHVSALQFLPKSDRSALSSGNAGLDMASVKPANPMMQEMIAAWQNPPLSASDAPSTPPTPESPQSILRPDSEVAPSVTVPAPPLPNQTSADLAPMAQEAVAPPEKPKSPESNAKRPAEPVASPPKKKPSGSGAGSAGGNAGSAPAATVDQSGSNTQRAEWGAAIRSRIERRKTYPAAANGAKGKVVLKLRVATDGRLVRVSISQSSGNPALDDAALAAVKSAGQFPKAPKGVATEIGFTLPMTFKP